MSELTLTDVLVSVVMFLLLVTGITLSVRRWWYERGHGQSLAALAKERGLQYVPRDDRQVLPHGYPFGVGSRRRAENVLCGEVEGRMVLAFDYVYETDGGGRTRVERFGVVMVRLPQPLTEVEVLEGPSPITFLGLDDVRFGSEEFDTRFSVRARERPLAYEVLSPQTMLSLLTRKRVALRLIDHQAVSWKRGRLRRDDLDEHLGTISALVDGIPERIWQAYRRPA